MEKEKIVCSALKYKDQILAGICQTNIMNNIISLVPNFDATEFKLENQGFITSTGRFVDRYEAYIIAKANKQIKHKILDFEKGAKPFLMSINLYKY